MLRHLPAEFQAVFYYKILQVKEDNPEISAAKYPV